MELEGQVQLLPFGTNKVKTIRLNNWNACNINASVTQSGRVRGHVTTKDLPEVVGSNPTASIF